MDVNGGVIVLSGKQMLHDWGREWGHHFLALFNMRLTWSDQDIMDGLNLSLVFFSMLGSLLLLLQLRRQLRLSATKHLLEIELRRQRDPYKVYLGAHSLRAANGYMGASRMVQLLEDLEKAALRSSTTHGDITKLWPIFEELRFAWSATRALYEVNGSEH